MSGKLVDPQTYKLMNGSGEVLQTYTAQSASEVIDVRTLNDKLNEFKDIVEETFNLIIDSLDTHSYDVESGRYKVLLGTKMIDAFRFTDDSIRKIPKQYRDLATNMSETAVDLYNQLQKKYNSSLGDELNTFIGKAIECNSEDNVVKSVQ